MSQHQQILTWLFSVNICSFMHHGVFFLQGFIFACMICAVDHINTVNKKMTVLTPPAVAGLSLEMLWKGWCFVGPSTLNLLKPGVLCSFHNLDEIKLQLHRWDSIPTCSRQISKLYPHKAPDHTWKKSSCGPHQDSGSMVRRRGPEEGLSGLQLPLNTTTMRWKCQWLQKHFFHIWCDENKTTQYTVNVHVKGKLATIFIRAVNLPKPDPTRLWSASLSAAATAEWRRQ